MEINDFVIIKNAPDIKNKVFEIGDIKEIWPGSILYILVELNSSYKLIFPYEKRQLQKVDIIEGHWICYCREKKNALTNC